jgi:DNA repair protein RecO (recombination protein O)
MLVRGYSQFADSHYILIMEETYKSKVIILDRKPFREHDARATVYSLEKGRMDFVVRGAKKIESKLSGHLEPFCLSNIMIVRGRQLDYIGGAATENAFINLKGDFDKINCAGEAVCIFKKTVKNNEPDERLFCLLNDFFNILNSRVPLIVNYELFINFFILKLMVCLGYLPRLYGCANCGEKISPRGNFFDLTKGGLTCEKCAKPKINELTISDDCIKVLRLTVKSENNFNELKKLKINNGLQGEVVKIIGSFYNYNFN